MKRVLTLATIATLGAAAYAYAADSAHTDAVDAQNVRISLAEAIAIAEQHVGGKAIQAELEHENGSLFYDVEVNRGTQRMDVRVDVDRGSILSAKADEIDHEGEGPEALEVNDD